VSDPVAEFKQGNRHVWGTVGNWDEASTRIATVGPTLLDHVGIEEGMNVLDVGTGSGGTVAIPAAQRGARVVGSDLAPELFDAARRRATEAEVEIEWVEADAEQLPFEDERFDRVLSTFGHMFAPRHAVAAGELARVCKPGGVVGTTTWTPDGAIGSFLKTVGGVMPPPPDFAEPPILWGEEQHVREMFEPHGLEIEFGRGEVVFTDDSVETYMTFTEENLPPAAMAKAALGERWPELRAELIGLFERWNSADDGSVRIEGEFLITIGRKPE
jgi:SAM-dependent methyltransferase